MARSGWVVAAIVLVACMGLAQAPTADGQTTGDIVARTGVFEVHEGGFYLEMTGAGSHRREGPARLRIMGRYIADGSWSVWDDGPVRKRVVGGAGCNCEARIDPRSEGRDLPLDPGVLEFYDRAAGRHALAAGQGPRYDVPHFDLLAPAVGVLAVMPEEFTCNIEGWIEVQCLMPDSFARPEYDYRTWIASADDRAAYLARAWPDEGLEDWLARVNATDRLGIGNLNAMTEEDRQVAADDLAITLVRELRALHAEECGSTAHDACHQQAGQGSASRAAQWVIAYRNELGQAEVARRLGSLPETVGMD